VTSPSTRRRDLTEKRTCYRGIGVAEYWVIDPPSRAVRVVRLDRSDRVVVDEVFGHPGAAPDPLRIEVAKLFA